MKRRIFPKFCLGLLIVLGAVGGLSAKPYTPKAGTSERKAILDALRVPAQKRARQPVVFYHVDIKADNGWAFLHCVTKDKTGKKYPLGDLATSALLRKTNGRWRVLHWGVAGDIGVACEAHRKFPHSPRSIYGGILSGCG